MSAIRIHPDLPIFRLDAGGNAGIYVPGLLTVMTRDEADGLIVETAHMTRPPVTGGRVALYTSIAERAKAAWDQYNSLSTAAFEPECLTVYLSNRCNLKCGYCYSAPREAAAAGDRYAARGPLLAIGHVRAAAAVVAESCRRKGRRFTLVVHGGGEPTLHPVLLAEVCAETRAVAKDFGLAWWGYAATNGVMPAERARWLVRTFDQIGLSCDGPDEIQALQRPAWNNRVTTVQVERSAEIFRQAASGFSVRATITVATVDRQTEIVDYIATALGCGDIRFEPAYLAGDPGTTAGFAQAFVDHFERAATRASELGCQLRMSGTRLDEIHGPYCNLTKGVLQVTPDGTVSNCFLTVDETQALREGTWLGRAGRPREHGALRMMAAATTVPTGCRDCVNIVHCTRDCPNVCYAAGDDATGGVRCEISKYHVTRRLRNSVAEHVGQRTVAIPIHDW